MAEASKAIWEDPEFQGLSEVARLVCCYFAACSIRTPEAMRESAGDLVRATGVPLLLVTMAIEEIISKGGEKLVAKYGSRNEG